MGAILYSKRYREFGGKEQRAELRVREFREFGTASLRGITVVLLEGSFGCKNVLNIICNTMKSTTVIKLPNIKALKAFVVYGRFFILVE